MIELPIVPNDSAPTLANASEVQPWLIVQGEGEAASVAQWRLETADQPALALFTEEGLAANYAESFCTGPARLVQPSSTELTRVLLDCYQQGATHAALNPNGQTAQRLFVLRDVLQSAREQLRASRP